MELSVARRQRIVIPGQALHIVQRGNNRQAVFFADEDYRLYLDTMMEAAEKYGCCIHAYVLMTNHVHFLLTPDDEEGPARVMQALGRRYVRYVNRVYQRSGTLWEGRYKSAIVDSERYLLTCSRYIELNPQRANMVASPELYKWSSYRCNALGELDHLVSPHEVYQRLGRSHEERLSAYRSLFKVHLDRLDIDRIRLGTSNGTFIGNDRFLKEIEKMARKRIECLPHGGDRKSDQFTNEQMSVNKRSSDLTP